MPYNGKLRGRVSIGKFFTQSPMRLFVDAFPNSANPTRSLLSDLSGAWIMILPALFFR